MTSFTLYVRTYFWVTILKIYLLLSFFIILRELKGLIDRVKSVKKKVNFKLRYVWIKNSVSKIYIKSIIKSWPILYRKLLYEMGQDFLDIQYIREELIVWWAPDQLLVQAYHLQRFSDVYLQRMSSRRRFTQ